MTKKILSLLIVAVLVIGMLPTTVMAADCTHENKTVKFDNPATCGMDGSKYWKCDDCGHSELETTPATGEHSYGDDGLCTVCGAWEPECEHDYQVVREEPATCQYAAYVWYECSKCGAEKSGEEGSADPDAHVYVDGVCACGAEEAKCEHATTRTETVMATCVKEGSLTTICSDCDEVLSEEVLPVDTADGHAFLNGACLLCGEEEVLPCEHNYETVKETPATCTDGGYVWEKCSLCGNEHNYETPALGGEHEFEVVKEQEPTCNEAGYVWEKCSKCGFEKNHEGDPATGVHGETYVDIYESTCAKHGYKKTICKVCDTVISEEELPLSEEHVFHNGKCLLCGIDEPICEHATTHTDTVLATCVKEGIKKTICSDCDEVLSEEVLPVDAVDGHAFLNGACLLCGAEEVLPCEHNYEVVKEQAATCTEGGYIWEKCTLCGWEHNYETPAIGGEHEYEVVKEQEATCAEAGYVWKKCAKCGNEYNHETDPATDEHGDTRLDIVMPSCVKEGVEKTICKVCDKVLSEKVLPVDTVDGHAYYNGKCLLCGAEEVECAHEVTRTETIMASCVKEGKIDTICKACDEILSTEILPVNDDHAFYDGKCLLCGAEEKAPECEHKYEIVKEEKATCILPGYVWEKCSLCGNEHNYETVIDADAHDYEAAVTAPTCKTEGFTTHTCKLCGDSYVDSVVEVVEHSYKDVVTEATCTEDGKVVYTCESCGDEKTEVIKSEGHKFAEGKCTVCGEAEAENDDINAPQTGDETIVVFVVFAMSSLFGMALILSKKRFA